MVKERKRQSAQIDRGTEATQARLREGTLERLLRTGRMGLLELRASDEIQGVYNEISRTLSARGMRYGERLDKGVEGDPVWFKQAYQERYKPWAEYYSKRWTNKDPDTYGKAVCIDICCGYYQSARAVDRKYKWRNGTASKVLISGLRMYCISAGWVRGELLRDWSEQYSL